MITSALPARLAHDPANVKSRQFPIVV